MSFTCPCQLALGHAVLTVPYVPQEDHYELVGVEGVAEVVVQASSVHRP